METTIPETVAALVREGVVSAADAPIIERRISDAVAAAGHKVWMSGRKFVPELGGVVDTIVPALIDSDELDSIVILAEIDFYV